MGLDMYLEKSHWIGAKYHKVTGSIDLAIDDKPVKVNLQRLSTINEQVAYWRKANAIHGWFVRNIQDDKDNCAVYFVGPCKLQELLDICKKVAKNHKLAPKLLPVQVGFFFGSNEYDEMYFDDLASTIKMLTKILKEDNLSTYYHYHSSW